MGQLTGRARLLATAGGSVAAVVFALTCVAAPALAATSSPSVRTVSSSKAGSAAKAGTTTAGTTKAPQVVASCSVTPAKGHFRCFALRRALSKSQLASSGRFTAQVTTNPPGLSPANLHAAYSLPSGSTGAGHTVYVIDAHGYPTAESDLAAYRKHFGLPACTKANHCLHIYNQNGHSSPLPSDNAGWAGETALDLDMVSAVCPACSITLIQAATSGNDLLTAVKRANTLGAKFVSMSWGGVEQSAATQVNMDSAYFASAGVVYTASSGDDGYADGVIYPATSRRVVSVGGTHLVASGNTRGWSESAWDGAGSGCSANENPPSWQAAIHSTCTYRATTDVSAVADPDTGVAVYQTYGLPSDEQGWQVYGGTSASAPIIAATYALAGPPKSTDHPASFLYAGVSHLHDIAAGSNGSCGTLLCNAVTGWDGPTGLGTPNGLAAFTAPHPTSTAAVVSSAWLAGSSSHRGGSVGSTNLVRPQPR